MSMWKTILGNNIYYINKEIFTTSMIHHTLLSNSENREHLKNFRNVDCVLANKVQDTQAKYKTTN